MTKRPVALVILDGVGEAPAYEGNAVTLANTPNLDKWTQEYPNILMHASGEPVGLPEGQMGNSEVGHMNIGAGRTVYQSLALMNKDIREGGESKDSVSWKTKQCCKGKSWGKDHTRLHTFNVSH